MTARAALESLGWRVTTLPDGRIDLTDTRGDGARVWLSVGDDGEDATLSRWLVECVNRLVARRAGARSALDRARAEYDAANAHLDAVVAAGQREGVQ